MSLHQILGETNLFLSGATFGMLPAGAGRLPNWNVFILALSCLLVLSGWVVQFK